MEVEAQVTAPADAGGSSAAPPAASEPAPQAAPAPPGPEAPTASPGAPTEKAKPEPDDEAFDLDAWDGDIGSLPDELSTLAKALQSKLKVEPAKAQVDRKTQDIALQERISKLEERESKLAELEERSALLEAFLNGEEDPRIAQTKSLLDQREKAVSEAAARAEKAEKELAEYRTQVEAMEIERARETWDAWKAENPGLVKSDKDVDTIVVLLDEGWALDQIPRLAGLSKSAAKQARDLVKAGEASPKVALQLFSERPKEERQTSSLVSGATGPTGTPAEMKEGKYAASYSDLKDNAISRALRKLA